MDPRLGNIPPGIESSFEIPPHLAEDFAKVQARLARSQEAIDNYRSSTNPERFSILRDQTLIPLFTDLGSLYIAAHTLPESSANKALVATLTEIKNSFKTLIQSSDSASAESSMGVLRELASLIERSTTQKAPSQLDAPQETVESVPVQPATVTAAPPTNSWADIVSSTDTNPISPAQVAEKNNSPLSDEEFLSQLPNLEQLLSTPPPEAPVPPTPQINSPIPQEAKRVIFPESVTESEHPSVEWTKHLDDALQSLTPLPDPEQAPPVSIATPPKEGVGGMFVEHGQIPPQERAPRELIATHEQGRLLAALFTGLGDFKKTFDGFVEAKKSVDMAYGDTVPAEQRQNISALYTLLQAKAAESTNLIASLLDSLEATNSSDLGFQLVPAEKILFELNRDGMHASTNEAIAEYGKKLDEALAIYRSVMAHKISIVDSVPQDESTIAYAPRENMQETIPTTPEEMMDRFRALNQVVEERDADITRANLERGVKALKTINAAIDAYKNMPKAVKWSVTAGVIGLGVGASLGAGMSFPAALVFVLSKKALNVVAGTAVGFTASKIIEQSIDMGMDAATKKWKPWFDKYPEATKFIRELRGVAGAVGGVAAGMWAAGLTPSFDGPTDIESSTNSSELDEKSATEKAVVAATKTAEAVSTDIPSSPIAPETVERGDTVWAMIREDMETRPDLKDAFNALSPEEQSAAIDRIENRLQALSAEDVQEMGIASGDLDLVKAGEVVDLEQAIDVSDLKDAVEEKAIEAPTTETPAPPINQSPVEPTVVTTPPIEQTPQPASQEVVAATPETTPESSEWTNAQTQEVMNSLVNHFVEQPKGGFLSGIFGAGADDAAAISWLYGTAGEPTGINGTTIANLVSDKPEGPYTPQTIASVTGFLEAITKGTGIDLTSTNWQNATVEEVTQAALSKGMELKTPWFTEFLNSTDARGVRTLLGG